MDTPTGASLRDQLVARGVPVIGTSQGAANGQPGLRRHEHVRVLPVPPGHDPALVPALVRLAREHEVTMVVPTSSAELPALAGGAACFHPRTSVAIAGPGPVSIAQDKLFTCAHLLARGVRVPKFAVAGDFTSPEDAVEALGLPLVVKPRVSSGSAGLRIVERVSELNWSALDDAHLLQEFVPGPEYVAVLWRPWARSQTRGLATVLEKVDHDGGQVGTATRVRRLSDETAPDVAALAVAAVRALGLMGPIDLDIRRRRDGTPVVLDANARFGPHSAAVPELLDAVLTTHHAQRNQPDGTAAHLI